MCLATMSTCTCAVSVTVLGVNSNQFWPVHTPTACSYALLSSISKLSLIHQSMQGRVQYGQIGVLTEDRRYCSKVRPVRSWTCTILCQLCLQRFNHTLAIFIMQHYSAYGQIELSSCPVSWVQFQPDYWHQLSSIANVLTTVLLSSSGHISLTRRLQHCSWNVGIWW